MKRILVLLSGSFLLTISCDDLRDYTRDINVPPSLTIARNANEGYVSLISDSDKIIQGSSYHFTYRIAYPGSLPLHYEFIKGNGDIIINPKDSVVSIYPQNNEEVRLQVYVTDFYNNRSTATLNLALFYNLPPIALFTYTLKDNVLTVMATSSYDQDKKWGGYLTSYEYSLNDNKIISDDGRFIQELEPNKSYRFSLRVKDNENTWSEINQQTINNF